MSVVLIDIDHFKAYNDRYGHQAGDQCLRDVANAVRRAARRRPLDLVARYGGEELIAVLFGADRAHAENVARAVLEAVRELRIPHAGSTDAAVRHRERRRGDARAGLRVLARPRRAAGGPRARTPPRRRGRDGWAFHDAEPRRRAALRRDAGELLKTAS